MFEHIWIWAEKKKEKGETSSFPKEKGKRGGIRRSKLVYVYDCISSLYERVEKFSSASRNWRLLNDGTCIYTETICVETAICLSNWRQKFAITSQCNKTRRSFLFVHICHLNVHFMNKDIFMILFIINISCFFHLLNIWMQS